MWFNLLGRSAVNRKVGGSNPCRSVRNFCGFDYVLVQSWIRSETFLSQDLFEVYYFFRLSVNESLSDLL